MGVGAQLQYTDEAIVQSHLCCTHAWVRTEPPSQTAKSYVKFTQSQKEPYIGFLSQLKDAIQKTFSQPELQDLLMQTLSFEDSNVECQKVRQPLKAQNAPSK